MDAQGDGLDGFELTAAAKRELAALIERTTGEVKLRARLYAEGRGAAEIERRDIAAASRDMLWAEREMPTARRSYVKWLGVAAGVATSVTIAVAINVASLKQADSVAALMGSLVGVLGVLVASYAGISAVRAGKANAPSSAEAQERADAWELVAVWRDIETILREDGPIDRESSRRVGPSQLAQAYAEENSLGSDFVENVRSLLTVRNRLVHGGASLSHSETRDGLDLARSLMATLEGIRARRSQTNGDGKPG